MRGVCVGGGGEWGGGVSVKLARHRRTSLQEVNRGEGIDGGRMSVGGVRGG